MKWLDPMPIDCPTCGGRVAVPVAALRSLQAVCPDCGVALKGVGEWMSDEEVRVRREVDLFFVGYELGMRYDLPETEILSARTLGDLARSVGVHLGPVADRETRAITIVEEVARRVAPRLLSGTT